MLALTLLHGFMFLSLMIYKVVKCYRVSIAVWMKRFQARPGPMSRNTGLLAAPSPGLLPTPSPRPGHSQQFYHQPQQQFMNPPGQHQYYPRPLLHHPVPPRNLHYQHHPRPLLQRPPLHKPRFPEVPCLNPRQTSWHKYTPVQSNPVKWDLPPPV